MSTSTQEPAESTATASSNEFRRTGSQFPPGLSPSWGANIAPFDLVPDDGSQDWAGPRRQPEAYLGATLNSHPGVTVADVTGVDEADYVADMSFTPTVMDPRAVGPPPARIEPDFPTLRLPFIEEGLAMIGENRDWLARTVGDSSLDAIRERLVPLEEELQVLNRLTKWGLHILFDPLDEREVALHDALASALVETHRMVSDARTRLQFNSPQLERVLEGLSRLNFAATLEFGPERRRAVLQNSAQRFRFGHLQDWPHTIPAQSVTSQLLDDYVELPEAVGHGYGESDSDSDME